MMHSLAGFPEPLVLTDLGAVETYMAEKLGFEWDVLRKALQHGGSDAAMTTSHNVAASAGFRFWDGTMQSLRDQLVPQGWRALLPGGLEVVLRPDNVLQVAGTLGDASVGYIGGSPNYRHQKGESTDAAMAVNQMTLAGHGEHPGWEPILTWWVLYRFSGLGDRRVVPELSLPRRGAGGRVSEWAVRLMLPEVELHSPAVDPGLIPGPAESVDVAVTRRTGSGS